MIMTSVENCTDRPDGSQGSWGVEDVREAAGITVLIDGARLAIDADE